MATELRKSNVEVSAAPLSTRTAPASISKTSAVFGQLAKLGAAGIQVYQNEHEKTMERQAKNDLVNKTINPDLQIHEGAYAQTVAKGQALQGYNQYKADVEAGKYNHLSPEDFQAELNRQHMQYKESRATSKFASLETEAYDDLWLQNEATITAGHAGMYRKQVQVDQGKALHAHLGEVVKIGGVEPGQVIQEALSPAYSMLDEEDRISSVLQSAVSHALDNPVDGLKLLEGLNESLNFTEDPKRAALYRASVTKANKDIASIKESSRNQAVLETITELQDMEDKGLLTKAHYSLVEPLLDNNGNPIATPKQFAAMVKRSQINRAELDTFDRQKRAFRDGNDIGDSTTKNYDKIAQSTFRDAMIDANGDTVVAIENMGRFLVNQSKDWDELKDRAQMFERQLMVVNGEVNKDAMLRYEELAALERGMSFNKNGDKTFARYMGKSLPQYQSIQEAMKMTKDTKEGAWKTVAESLDLQKQKSKEGKVQASLGADAVSFGKSIADSIWDAKDNPWVLDAVEGAQVPSFGTSRVSNVVARAYQEHIAAGWSVEASKRAAATKGHSQVYKWGGELYDTQGIDPKVIFGTTDPEGAFNTLISDPEWGARLKDMFGVTFGEMYFGRADYDPTEEGIREQLKDREGKTLYMAKDEIVKEIDLETGMLNFRSQYGTGTVMSIPLADIGAQHEAFRQGIGEIARLDRLYDPEFLGTKAGKDWAFKQAGLNSEFLTNILRTEKSAGRTAMTPQEFIGMPDELQTRARLEFYKDVYTGVKGRARQLFDFFNIKREVDTAVEPTIIAGDIPAKDVIPSLSAQSIGALIPMAEGTSDYKAFGYESAYDVTYNYGTFDPKGSTVVTDMTLEQGIAHSEAIRKNPKNSANAGPIGKYQFLGSTIKDVYKKAGLSMTDKLTPENQDKLMEAKLNQIGLQKVQAGTMTKKEFSRRLKKTWVGFEVHPTQIDKLLK